MGTHPIFESDFDCLTERMFRKFDEKESVSSVSQLKSSVQKNIRNQIIDTYPTFEPYFTEIWPKKEPARLAKTHEKVEVLVVNHEPIFFKCRDSQWLPNIRILHQYPFLLPIQQVDEGAIIDMETEKGAGVQVVHCEGKELPIAVGTMAM